MANAPLLATEMIPVCPAALDTSLELRAADAEELMLLALRSTIIQQEAPRAEINDSIGCGSGVLRFRA
eukprot:4920518-Amphidinium_carterae.1